MSCHDQMGICHRASSDPRNETDFGQLGSRWLGTRPDRPGTQSRERCGVLQAAIIVSQVADRLAERGLELPPIPQPLAAYVPAVEVDGWIYTAGQLPLRDGVLTATGQLGADVDIAAASAAAEVAALNALAAISGVVGDLDRIQLVKMVGFVSSTADFTDQPAVMNGASVMLGEVLGQYGAHARSAVGVASLPLGAAVELELVARIREETIVVD